MMGEIREWATKRKSAWVLNIIQGRTTGAQANRVHDLLLLEIEQWIKGAKQGNGEYSAIQPLDIREQHV